MNEYSQYKNGESYKDKKNRLFLEAERLFPIISQYDYKISFLNKHINKIIEDPDREVCIELLLRKGRLRDKTIRLLTPYFRERDWQFVERNCVSEEYFFEHSNILNFNNIVYYNRYSSHQKHWSIEKNRSERLTLWLEMQ